jgi:hypothetical protein
MMHPCSLHPYQQLALVYALSGKYQEAFAEAHEAAALSQGSTRTEIRVIGIQGVICALGEKTPISTAKARIISCETLEFPDDIYQ